MEASSTAWVVKGPTCAAFTATVQSLGASRVPYTAGSMGGGDLAPTTGGEGLGCTGGSGFGVGTAFTGIALTCSSIGGTLPLALLLAPPVADAAKI